MNKTVEYRAASDFLVGDGEMCGLIRGKDWSATPLGPIDSWPQSLKTTVSLCLASNFPINIMWGPEHIQIYNDGYRAICGASHPQALGEPYTVTWASAWPAIGQPFANALAGNTSYLENQRMFLARNGYLEETFFTFSTSPIRDETGGIGGLFHPVTETTPTMLSERRTRALRELHAALADIRATPLIPAASLAALQPYAFDLPFLAFYQLNSDSSGYSLVAHNGVGPGHGLPAQLFPDMQQPFAVSPAIASTHPCPVSGLSPMFGGTTCGPYDQVPDNAFLLPLWVPGDALPVAIVLAGASARLPLNKAYEDLFSLLTGTLSAGYANARFYEEERERAEALAALDKAKTTFFSNVSHEFRTPLTLMLGPLEDALLHPEDLPPHQLERLTLAHRSALRLLKLVNSLLDFARLESGRAGATFREVDLGAFTAELASNFESACERAGIALHISVPAVPVPAFIDQEMWEKITLNLLSNAFKYTLSGAIHVNVTPMAGSAVLTVRDTGVGIAAEDQPLVFKRFHRIENQAGRTFEGTGIGLSLVDELVKLHGGTLGLESAIGVGSTFAVSIPLGSSHLPSERIGAQPSVSSTGIRAQAYVEEALRWLPDAGLSEQHAPAGPTADAPRPRILLADDNTDMRGYIASILGGASYEIEAVDNGLKALQAAKAQVPDLILSDVMMPGLDGFALLQAVRNDPALRNVVFILLSARAGEEARVEGLKAGADDYLVKPFNARELRARIDGAIRLGQQRVEAHRREQALHDKASREREALVVQFHQMQKTETIGQLTGGVAHDFNNLLTPIFASLEMLKRRFNDDDRAVRIASAGLESAERAKVLVSRLLAFARKQNLDVRPVDLKQLIVGMQDLLKRSIEEDIALEFSLGSPSRLAMADANQMELALLNLCLNARDAMPNGGTLSITLSEVQLPLQPNALGGTEDHLQIVVRDNGAGMDEHTLARSIEPFFTTKGAKGTGLGLSMVHGVVAQLGGQLLIESQPGQGTQVRVLLPASEAPAAVEAPAAQGSEVAAGKATILVVDDEALVRMTVAEMLGDEGYIIHEADSGERAFELVRQGLLPDLLITDFKMPGMNGSELANKVRSVAHQVAVLVITGYAELELEWPTLPKPFAYAALLERVREQLGQEGTKA
ncbi:ATP-binding protein [Pseudomonas japonica]|uniref:ATP-binding protein n=1 Tax=Pseudomonas japonica TaxID=256466 RepID=UPI0015E35070|nr:ATP-binding protein [Pseudomonas japonica]MBA1289440.1 response regulator [Pseudomonas japonica]